MIILKQKGQRNTGVQLNSCCFSNSVDVSVVLVIKNQMAIALLIEKYMKLCLRLTGIIKKTIQMCNLNLFRKCYVSGEGF